MNSFPAFGEKASYISIPGNLTPEDGRVDPLDIRIMCHLGLCPNIVPTATRRRPNPARVAKELKIDSKTVKSRMERWEKSGFLKYYQIVPKNSVLGVKSSLYLFSFDDIVKKYAMIKKVRLVEGSLSLVNLLGGSFGVWLAYEDEEERKRRLSLLVEVTGCQEPPKLVDDIQDPFLGRLSGLDWKIIRCLRDDALKPLPAIAEACGVSKKTVKFHMERMIKEDAFYSTAIFDSSRVSGLIIYALAVVIDEAKREEALRELGRKFGEKVFAQWASAGNVLYCLWATNAGEPEESYVTARNVKGVAHVETVVVKEVIEFPELINKLVERKIREMARSSALRMESIRLPHKIVS